MRAARLDLADIGHGLIKELLDGGKGHHERLLLDEGDGAVLQFTCRIGLGMNVGDLLELQAALEAGRAVEVAAD